MKEIIKKKNSGFVMRLIQTVVYLLLLGVGVIVFLKDVEDYNTFGTYGIVTSITLLAQASLFFVLQLVFAFVGNKTKGANIASIVVGSLNIALWIILWIFFYIVIDLGANENVSLYLTYLLFALLGIFGIIGGAQGAKHGIFPEKKLYAGFACRLTQAILNIIWSLPFFICAFIIPEPILLISLLPVGVFFILLAALQFVFAYKGKKSKGANVASVVFNALLALGVICLPGFIGGIQGIKYLKVHPEGYIPEPKQKKTKVQSEQEQQSLEDVTTVTDTSTDVKSNVSVSSNEPIVLTRVAELSPKAKKNMMLVEIVSYSLLLLVGVLMSAIPSFGNLFVAIGLCQDISARAYGITVGVMMVALVPTIGYYIATVAPLSLSKRIKVITAAVSAVLSVIMTVVFFVVIYAAKVNGIAVNEYFENDDVWFIPVSMVFAELGIAVCYVMLFFRFKPEKIKDINVEETDSVKLSEQSKNVLQIIARFIVKCLKSVLRFKERSPEIFIFVATFLFTWLVYFTSFVVSIIAIVFIVTLILMLFFKVVELGINYDLGDAYEVINNSGCRQTVYSNDGKNFYAYNGSFVGVSNDGGKTLIWK